MENNVKCENCGKDILCEQCAKEPGDFKHLCLECYQKGVLPKDKEKTHLVVPPEKLAEEYDRFLSQMVGGAFDDMWANEKKKLKEQSKQEIAQTCFFEGARFMLVLMRKMSQESQAPPAKEEPK